MVNVNYDDEHDDDGDDDAGDDTDVCVYAWLELGPQACTSRSNSNETKGQEACQGVA